MEKEKLTDCNEYRYKQSMQPVKYLSINDYVYEKELPHENSKTVGSIWLNTFLSKVPYI